MFGSILSMVLAAVAVGLLILVHELGHFLAAKAVGVRVEVFSIGFWKKILSRRHGDTEYRLSIIPLGGYVKLAGESPEDATGAPDEFWSKSPGQRSLVFVAGVGMNMVLAMIGFIAAYAVGVPFTVAEIGQLEKAMPAWEAGMRKGDVITRVNGVTNPDFQDVTRQVALKGLHTVPFDVRRNGETITYQITPRYDERAGIRRIGFSPPIQPVVSGLVKTRGENGRCPAQEAGIKVEDRLVSVAGQEIQTAQDLSGALRGKVGETVRVVVERNGGEREFQVSVAPDPGYKLGISGVGNEITSLQADAMAERAGFEVGDKITAVNGAPVRSLVGIDEQIQGAYGETAFTVEKDGAERTITVDIPDYPTLDEFLFSFHCESSNELAWLLEGGPAWEAGMRPGDRIVSVADQDVGTWEDITLANANLGGESRQITWVRDGEQMSADVQPVKNPMDESGYLGIVFDRPRRQIRRYGVAGAVGHGVYKTYASMVDILLTIRGFFSQQVSTRNVGGVVLIAYSSYRAAEQGMGKLLYLMAVISGALAFLNILPIPVLDGGHLMFTAIEKVRGKPISDKVRAISQAIGMALLLALVVYAIRNDIVRLFDFL